MLKRLVRVYLWWILWLKLLVKTQETEIRSNTYKIEKQKLWKRARWRFWDFERTPKPWQLAKIYWILGFPEPLCMEISGVYVWNLIYPVKTSIQIFSSFQWTLAEWIQSTSMIFQSFPRSFRQNSLNKQEIKDSILNPHTLAYFSKKLKPRTDGVMEKLKCAKSLAFSIGIPSDRRFSQETRNPDKTFRENCRFPMTEE